MKSNQCPKCLETFSPANLLVHRCTGKGPVYILWNTDRCDNVPRIEAVTDDKAAADRWAERDGNHFEQVTVNDPQSSASWTWKAKA